MKTILAVISAACFALTASAQMVWNNWQGTGIMYASNPGQVTIGTAPTAAVTWTGAQVFSGGATIKGTATNNSASAGYVGEVISSTIASASAVSLTTATPANVTSISLTAGDWEVSGTVIRALGATTSVTQLITSISTTSATASSATAGDGSFQILSTAANVMAANTSQVVPPIRISVASTTTIYLVASDTFTVSTDAVFGTLRARRVR